MRCAIVGACGSRRSSLFARDYTNKRTNERTSERTRILTNNGPQSPCNYQLKTDTTIRYRMAMMADKNNPPFIKFDRTFVDALAHRIVGRGMSHRVVVRADKWTVEPSNSCAGKQTLHILLYPAQQAGSIGKITQSDESVRQILCVLALARSRWPQILRYYGVCVGDSDNIAARMRRLNVAMAFGSAPPSTSSTTPRRPS